MNRLLLTTGLVVLSIFPVLAQDKEQDRVENAGKAMKEILDDAVGFIEHTLRDAVRCIPAFPRLPSLVHITLGMERPPARQFGCSGLEPPRVCSEAVEARRAAPGWKCLK